jgi:hypothetical protein
MLAWMFAWLSPALFAQYQTLHSVWGALEWAGNTLVFLLAGLLVTTRSLVRIEGKDFANLIVLYIVLNIIRFIMVFAFFPVLTRVGKGCSLKEAVFISFSGLRGAIAIALVLSVVQRQHYGTTTISDRNAELVLFYVGGFSCLTLLVNATAAGSLLSFLRIGRTDLSDHETETIRHYARKRIIASGAEMMTELPEEHAVLITSACKLLTYEPSFAYRADGRGASSNVDSVHESANDPDDFFSRMVSVESQSETSEDIVATEEKRIDERERPVEAELTEASAPTSSGIDYSGVDDTTNLSTLITPNRPTSAAQMTPVNMRRSFKLPEIHAATPEEIGAELARSTFRSINRDLEAGGGEDSPSRRSAYLDGKRRSSTQVITNEAMLTYIRDCFLHVVRTYYWKCVHTGQLSRHSVALQLLLSSVELGLETTHTPGLQDWEFIKRVHSTARGWYSDLHLRLPASMRAGGASLLSRLIHTDDDVVSVLTCFIAAHEYAQERIPVYLGEESVADTVEQAVVINESKKLVSQAANRLLSEFDPAHVKLLKSLQIVHSIQHHQEDQLIRMMDEGILKEHDAVVLFDELHADYEIASLTFQRAVKTLLTS